MKYSFLFCFLLFSGILSAQSDYRPGYYVTLKGDTISGLIDFRGDVFNAYNCNFKTSARDKAVEFRPGDVHAYSIQGSRLYISKTVTIDKYGTNKTVTIGSDSIRTVVPAEKIKITAFLECLVKGEISTYFLRTSDYVNYFFVEDKQGNIQTLDNNTVVHFTSIGQKSVSTTNQYVGALSYFAKDYPALRADAGKIRFDRNSIVDFSEKYHDQVCQTGEKCLVFARQKKKDKIQFGVLIRGGSYNGRYVSIHQNFEGNTTSMGGGVIFESQMNNSSERLRFNLKATYDRMSVEGKYKISYSNTYENYQADISVFQLAPSFVYVYDRYKLKPIVSLGVFVGRLQFSNWKKDEQDFKNTQFNSAFNYGLNAAVGAQYQKHLRLMLAADIAPGQKDDYFGYVGVQGALCYLF